MARVLILADDLSGAADCGIACINAGLNTIVSLDLFSDGFKVEVLSVDADTRSLSAAAAAERMRCLVQVHAEDPALLLFKKIDSTLRGHLGPELAAVLAARRAIIKTAVAIMAPAFPVNGRTTVGGMHYIHGRPLHETEIWKNQNMIGKAYIPQMFEGSGLTCTCLDLSTVRSGHEALVRAAHRAAQASDVLVCDAETDGDLLAIARCATDLREQAVWVGSAGLAHQLPRATGFGIKAEDVVPHLPATSGSILFVIGSTSGTTKQQAVTLLSSSDIHGIVVPPEVLLDGPEGPDWSAFTNDLYEAVNQGEDVILVCGAEPQVDVIDRSRLSIALAEMTASLHGRVGALVASGGETARKVLDRWGVQTLQLHGELERGVPVSSAVIGGSLPLTVITKAGDFGQPYTLMHCREWLKQKRGA
ncbi:MAG: four-carbon acid sugar kinase family protein [Edaphobacter sp.]